MKKPHVLYLTEEDSYLDIFERSGQVFLRGHACEDGAGFVRQLEPEEAKELSVRLQDAVSEALETVGTPPPPSKWTAYRGWVYLTTSKDGMWYPQVDHSAQAHNPVTLPLCPSEALAAENCRAWIDRHYAYEDSQHTGENAS